MNSNRSKHTKSRFQFLKSMFRQAPLTTSDLEELKFLAAKYDPRMSKWMKENPELCR
jgi:hypothetical protein